MVNNNYDKSTITSKEDMLNWVKEEIKNIELEIKQLEKEKLLIDVELKNTKNLAQRKVLIDDEKQIISDIEDLQFQLKGFNQYILNGKEEDEEKSEIINDTEASLETYETDEKNIDNEQI